MIDQLDTEKRRRRRQWQWRLLHQPKADTKRPQRSSSYSHSHSRLPTDFTATKPAQAPAPAPAPAPGPAPVAARTETADHWPAAVPLWARLMFVSLLVLSAAHQGCQCLDPATTNPLVAPLEPGIFGSLLGGSEPTNIQQQPPNEVATESGYIKQTGARSSASQQRQRQLKLQQANQQKQKQPQSQQLQSAAELQHQSYKNGQTSDKVTLPGDILLGGLFPIHMKGTKVECGEINRDRGIQRLEAMLYALDRINGDSQLLPEIKLGAILLDSCSSSTYALNQSLEFIRASINTVESSAFECKDKSAPRPKYGSKMIAGVIGGSYSEVSLQVANLLRLFRIPQVSYASTGTALSDKTLYDLFARTVPSDMFQARAIADIVLRLKWTYVSLVSSEGLYGDSGSKEFMKQASNRNICIAVHEKVAPTTAESAYDLIVASLLKRNATGVVLFTRAEDTRSLLLAVKRARLATNPFVWVAADGWGTHQKLVEGVEEVAWGAITVELQAKAIPGFDHYMKGLTPWQNARNPWFSEYWQEWFECQLEGNLLQQQQLASGYQKRRETTTGSVRESAPPPPPLSSAGEEDDYDNGQRRRRHLVETTTTTSTTTTTTLSSTTIASAMSNCYANASCVAAMPTSEPVVQTMSPGEAEVTTQQRQSNSLTRARRAIGSQQAVKQFCSPNLRISESNGYRQEQKVQFVVDAVYAMAHALHRAWFNLCDAQPGVVCEALKELNGGDFYSKYLLNVSFLDLAGSEVKFDERGDGLGRYNIYNFRRVRNPQRLQQSPALDGSDPSSTSAAAAAVYDESLAELSGVASSAIGDSPSESLGSPMIGSNNGSGGGGSQMEVEHIYTSNVEFEYSTIGRWTENEYDLQLSDIQFIQGDQIIPESYCSKPCEVGQAKLMRAGDHCCWICKTCAPYEYLPDENNCVDCGIGRWPHDDKRSCFDLPQKYLRWDSVYSLISLTIACVGIALTIFVSYIFIKYLDTPVVKASGRELSFILLAGIAFCHLSTFVLLSKPTTFICGSQRFLVNFGFALMYASLLVKTNRISRIFNCARKSAKRPSFISPKSQMLITGILVAIQIFLTIVWFVFEPPGIRADSPEGKRDEVILKCKAKGKSFIISLVYNMILITTCTVYAVKTRKIPENFNESKFIGFTMYTTIVIWLAFVTMFFGTNNSYEIQINTMCVCISLSAYVTLFCLFSPKLSIILLHPDKNVRKLTMNSATYKRPFKPVSSFASNDGAGNRQNATGGAGTAIGGNGTSGGYNGGPQTDGASGPMSTTSNVLNLAESQTARMQESSTISNVVNSNSAGSNGSQKVPTTFGQQLTLTGVCSNCGAHQTLSNQPALISHNTHHHHQHYPTTKAYGPGSTKHQQQQQHQQQINLQQKRHLAASSGLSGSDAQLAAGHSHEPLASSGTVSQRVRAGHTSGSSTQLMQKGAKMKIHHQQQRRHHETTLPPSRSSILVSSSGGSGGCGGSHSPAPSNASRQQGAAQAKVVHSRIGPGGQTADRGTNLQHERSPVKRMSSDDHLLSSEHRRTIAAEAEAEADSGNVGRQLPAAGPCWGSAQLKQELQSMNKNRSAYLAGGSIPSASATSAANKPQHMASMSRLNELNNNTSTTSSDRGHCIDESISSLANDSLANTTSQEMTPCNGGSALGTSALIQHQHQQQQQQQGCGDTPSGRRCTSSTRGPNNSAQQPAQEYVLSSAGAKGGSDSMLWNQSVYSIDYCSDCCPSYCHCSCPACSSSLGGDEPIDSGAICVHAATSSHQTADTELDEYDNLLCDSFVVQDQEPPEQQQQQQHKSCGGSQYQRQAGKMQKSGSSCAVALLLKHNQRDENEGDDLETTEFDNSLVDTCITANRSQTMELKTIGGDGAACFSGSSAKHATPKVISSSDDEASTQWPQVASKPLTVHALQAATNSALSAACMVTSPLLAASAGKQEQQVEQQHGRKKHYSTTSSRDKNSEKQQIRHHSAQSAASSSDQKRSGAGGGAIRASIELAKSTMEQRQLEKRQQRESGSSCFSSYHDDYELNYGLAPSDCEEYYHDGDRQPQTASDGCNISAHQQQDDKSRGGNKKRTSSSSNYHHHQYAEQADDGDGEDDDNCDDYDAMLNNDEDVDGDDDDDDFGHDGRLSLSRQHSSRTTASGRRRKHHGGSSRSSGSKPKLKSKELALDEHRINSVALVAATLSTGGAIVESSSVGETTTYQEQQSLSFKQAGASSSKSPSTGSDSADGHISCLTTL